MKEQREEQTLKKATNILGIGPIDDELKNHHNRLNKDNKTAITEAIKDFLGHHLGYNKELENIGIEEIQVASKDDIVYTALKNVDEIKK